MAGFTTNIFHGKYISDNVIQCSSCCTIENNNWSTTMASHKADLMLLSIDPHTMRMKTVTWVEQIWPSSTYDKFKEMGVTNRWQKITDGHAQISTGYLNIPQFALKAKAHDKEGTETVTRNSWCQISVKGESKEEPVDVEAETSTQPIPQVIVDMLAINVQKMCYCGWL